VKAAREEVGKKELREAAEYPRLLALQGPTSKQKNVKICRGEVRTQLKNQTRGKLFKAP